MHIRPAIVQDAQRIAEVHVESWRTTYAGIVPDEVLANLSVAQRFQNWSRILELGVGGVFVAEADDGTVLGFANGGQVRGKIPGLEGVSDLGELYAIYVLESAQGMGAGRALVNAVAGWLWDEGFTAMCVWVLTQNPACGFYERLGAEYVTEKIITIGIDLPETCYVWRDLL